MSKKKSRISDSPIKKQPPNVENALPAKRFVNLSKFIIPGIAGLLIVGAAAVYFYRNAAAKRTLKPFGATVGCQKIPPFVRGLGFGNGVALSTSDRFLQGLILVEGERKYQHPSWKSAGSLAPIQRDAVGNVYAAPAPWIDTLENKPDEQNKVYKIDANTQEMKEFAALPKRADSTPENPYGVLGLTFDCDTNSLYAATLAGSTRKNVRGAIYQINAETGKVVSGREDIDAIGLGVFNGAKGKRLYYGAARTSEIWSIDLSDDGALTGETRREFSFENLGARGDDKARRINFAQNAQDFEMSVIGIEFGFNLIAPSEKQETVYRYRYNMAKDAWDFQSEPPKFVGN